MYDKIERMLHPLGLFIFSCKTKQIIPKDVHINDKEEQGKE